MSGAEIRDEAVPPLEWAVAKLLRVGVIIAGLLMAVGWFTFLDFSANPLVEFHEYKSVPLVESLQLALQTHNWGLLISYAGLGLLVSLPMIRVLMTGFIFAYQRQRVLAGIAFFVFFILMVSLTLGVEL